MAMPLLSRFEAQVEQAPPEERASSYRVAAGSVKPRLSPDDPYSASRDPFQVKDPWAESAPALMAVPPVAPYPRALTGVETPLGEAPLLLHVDPKAGR